MHASTRQSLIQAIERAFAVSPGDAAAVLGALQPVVCRGGDWLFRQGDSGESLYLLARGRLQVWIASEEHGEVRESLVAEVAPGETVGEISLLTGGPRSASLRAVRDSLLLRMDAEAFDRLGREQPQLVRQLAGGIAIRLRDRTGGAASIRREVKTIAVLPLTGMQHAQALAARLGAALAERGPILTLLPDRLAQLGAPPLPQGTHSDASAAMAEWLGEQEDQHRFVLLVADAADSNWSKLALRHADLVLLAAASSGDPAAQPWERALLSGPGEPVARRALLLTHEGGAGTLSGTGSWLAGRDLSYHLHLRSGVPADLERIARVLTGEALGLVLGGGAARGFAHIGAYRAMVEAGVPIDWVGGTSIGAVMGAPIAQGLSPDEVISTARLAFVQGKPFGDLTLPVLSLLRGRRMERLIAEHLAGDIEDLPVPFFCVSSNLGQGTPHVHTRGRLVTALRASVSLPGVFPPAVVDGQLTIDGGILDNLPVDLMRRQPVGKVIAIDLTSRQSYKVEYGAVPSPWAVLAGRFLPFAKRHRVPSFMSLMLKATEIGTMAAVRASGERADLLLRPPVSRFSLTDVLSFDEIVEAGYQYTRQALEDWPHG
jgi:predicted acylesterase/phospholipase RssA/CRP-like cAMP-binding protein